MKIAEWIVLLIIGQRPIILVVWPFASVHDHNKVIWWLIDYDLISVFAKINKMCKRKQRDQTE